MADDFDGATILDREWQMTAWALFDQDTDYFGPHDRQAMVNYIVDDLDALLAQLRDADVPVDDNTMDGPRGKFAWATDPEGNRFELWQPPKP